MNEKDAWIQIVEPNDLDCHLENVEQAEANAMIVKKMFEKCPLAKNSRLLIHGCGTCQMFDYITPSDIGESIITFADISKKMLNATEIRLKKFNGIYYNIIEDDIENTDINGNYDAALLTLLLLHVDWKRGLDNIIKLEPSYIYIIEQEQEPGTSPITEGRNLPGSLQKYSELVTVKLVPRKELTMYLYSRRYLLKHIIEKEVPDNKVMIGLIFVHFGRI